MENLFKSELSAIHHMPYKVTKPKSPQKVSPVKNSPPKPPPPIDSPKSPIVDKEEATPSKKKKKPIFTPNVEQSKIQNEDKFVVPVTPKSKVEKPKTPIVAEMPTIPTRALIIKKNIAERSDLKVYKKDNGISVRNVHCQTLLVLVAEFTLSTEKRSKKGLRIFRPKNKEIETTERTRSIGCQTDVLTLSSDTVRWIDDQTKNQEVTSKVFGSCLRSYSRYIRDHTVTISFVLLEGSLNTPEVIKNRTHKCRMWFESLKNVDYKHYFYNPVRFEVFKYRRMIQQ